MHTVQQNFMKKNIIFLTFIIFFIALIFPNQTKAAVDRCQTEHPGWSCQDITKREDKGSGCESGLCPGGTNIRCCPPVAAAGKTGAEEGGGGLAKFTGFAKVKSIPELIGNVIRVVLGLVGSVALLMFVYGGMLWLTSGGNPDKIKKAKDTLVWASIGLIIIFASYALVGVIIRAVAK
jgi:hypothetical protein